MVQFIFQVYLSTGRITGIAPTFNTAFIVAAKVKSGTPILTPLVNPNVFNASSIATVPFVTVKMFPPSTSERFFSNFFINFPFDEIQLSASAVWQFITSSSLDEASR